MRKLRRGAMEGRQLSGVSGRTSSSTPGAGGLPRAGEVQGFGDLTLFPPYGRFKRRDSPPD